MERRRWKKEYNQGKDEARKQKERADRKKEEKFAREKAVGVRPLSRPYFIDAARQAKKRKQSLEKEKSSASVASRSASTSSVPRTAHTSVPIYSAPAPPPSASGSTSAPPPKKKQKMFLDSDSDDDMPLANLPKERKSSLKSGVRLAVEFTVCVLMHSRLTKERRFREPNPWAR
jgi:CCR4-NOT transcriptional regulation complex NOT5 subunit